VATGDTEIVSALRAAVADKLGQERFQLWFGTSTRFEWAGERLTIVVPNRFFQQWLRSNFSGEIEDACQQTLGTRPALEFRVDATMSAVSARDHATAHPADGNGEDKPEQTAPVDPGCDQSAMKPMAADSGAGLRRLAEFESFVVGTSNRLAHAAAESVIRRPGEISPLLIHGPTSVGKTHLLEGIWSAVRKRHRAVTAVYLSAEQFTTGFLQALRGSGLPSFRRKYRGVDLLILDDVQFFCGKRCTQTELFHTLDTLLRERRQVVLAADRAPAKLSDLAPELMSRLESGMVCRIDPPDYETRLGIVDQMAGRFAVGVPDEVRRYVASHLTHHARELSGAVCRLHATSRAWNEPITLAMAEEALAEMIRTNRRPVRLADIEKAMCEAFGLEPKTLQSKGKAQCVSHPRMLAMWLARKYTRSALSEISHYFGRRSHSTVISAEKRVERWRADGKPLHLAERSWKVEDAIRQVERCLRAG
jgi:chromosomal replication initiator protein